MSSASFPSTAPSRDIPFPLQGLPGEGFPCFNGTMACSDSRSLIPMRFVFLRLSVPSTPASFAPLDDTGDAEGPGASALRLAIPQATLLGWKRPGLSSSWGTPVGVPCSQTPAGPSRQATTARRCGLPLFVQRRLPRFASFEAQSHGPHTRCLRFAGWTTPPPRKTRFRLSATLCRTGCFLLQGPNERSQPCLITSHQPFPSFLDANETNPNQTQDVDVEWAPPTANNLVCTVGQKEESVGTPAAAAIGP